MLRTGRPQKNDARNIRALQAQRALAAECAHLMDKGAQMQAQNGQTKTEIKLDQRIGHAHYHIAGALSRSQDTRQRVLLDRTDLKGRSIKTKENMEIASVHKKTKNKLFGIN